VYLFIDRRQALGKLEFFVFPHQGCCPQGSTESCSQELLGPAVSSSFLLLSLPSLLFYCFKPFPSLALTRAQGLPCFAQFKATDAEDISTLLAAWPTRSPPPEDPYHSSYLEPTRLFRQVLSLDSFSQNTLRIGFGIEEEESPQNGKLCSGSASCFESDYRRIRCDEIRECECPQNFKWISFHSEWAKY
jgi:hypothetical protein